MSGSAIPADLRAAISLRAADDSPPRAEPALPELNSTPNVIDAWSGVPAALPVPTTVTVGPVGLVEGVPVATSVRTAAAGRGVTVPAHAEIAATPAAARIETVILF